MAALATHQQHGDAPMASSLDAKPSDEMSSSNVTDGEPDEKAVADAETGKQQDRKSTRLNSSHSGESRMPSSA